MATPKIFNPGTGQWEYVDITCVRKGIDPGWITPETYGAVGDGVTDDSAAIQAAIDAAGNAATVYLPKKTYYVGTTGIVISGTYTNFVCDGTIVYDGTDAAVIVQSDGDWGRRTYVQINAIHAENGTGIRLDASNGTLETFTVKVHSIRHSKIGVHLYSAGDIGGAICYNKLYIDEIRATDIGVLINPQNGYINEDWFWLGRIWGGCAYGIKIVAIDTDSDGAGGSSGGHKFHTGGFEGMADNGTALYLENSGGNVFRNFRCQENYGSTIIKFVGECEFNDVELSSIDLTKVDFSEMGDIGGNYNILRSPHLHVAYHRAGTVAYLNKKYGITYVPDYMSEAFVRLAADTFAGNVITQLNTKVLTSFRCDTSDLDGQTFTLGGIYSEYGSMTRGYPVSFTFGESNGTMLIADVNGDTIIDNREGKYAGKTVSLKWVGHNARTLKHAWLVQEQGQTNATEQFVKDYAQRKGDTETWTFTLPDGSAVAKKVVLA